MALLFKMILDLGTKLPTQNSLQIPNLKGPSQSLQYEESIHVPDELTRVLARNLLLDFSYSHTLDLFQLVLLMLPFRSVPSDRPEVAPLQVHRILFRKNSKHKINF
jgi:hypothetical protein